MGKGRKPQKGQQFNGKQQQHTPHGKHQQHAFKKPASRLPAQQLAHPDPSALKGLHPFAPCKKFAGARLGYAFKKGKKGVGYYLDTIGIRLLKPKLREQLVAQASANSAAASAKADAAKTPAKPAASGTAAAAATNGAPKPAQEARSPAAKDTPGPGGKKQASTPHSEQAAAAKTKGALKQQPPTPKSEAKSALKASAAAAARAAAATNGSGRIASSLSKKKAASIARTVPPRTASTEESSAGGDDSDAIGDAHGQQRKHAAVALNGKPHGAPDADGDGSEDASAADDSDSADGDTGDGGSGEDSEGDSEGGVDDDGAAAADAAEAGAGGDDGEPESGDGASAEESGSEGDAASDAEGEGAEAAAAEGAPESELEDGEDESDDEEEEEEESGEAAAGSSAAAAAAPAGAAADAAAEASAEAAAPEADAERVTFASLGVVAPLCDAIARLGWTHATEIQRQSLPLALAGRDVIGLAETGSGKTAAFALPILQALLAAPQRLFAAVLAPTRELAFQINEVMEALGSTIGLRTACVVGGIDMVSQAVALAKRPHVVIATPGRLVDHLENTKGFNLRAIKFLVLDEADRMLSMDFEEEINKLLAVIPRERNTYLFSATMTSKVAKLQRASLRDPAKVEVAHRFTTPKTLVQQYLFIPAKYKDVYLAYVLNELAGQSVIAFVATCAGAQRAALLLRALGFGAIALHGQMSQPKRLGALSRFKAGARSVLVATDVASRGLDLPAVDAVLNFDLPPNGKDYVHRVGRTARAGRAGRSVAFVTQYDVEVYQRLEALIGRKLPAYPADEEAALVLLERVSEAQRVAARELREADMGKGGKKRRRAPGDEEGGEDGAAAVDAVVRKFSKKGGGGGAGAAAGGAVGAGEGAGGGDDAAVEVLFAESGG